MFERLAVLIGEANAAKLVQAFPGERIPERNPRELAARNTRLRDLRSQGWPIYRLMDEFGLSRRQVFRIIGAWS